MPDNEHVSAVLLLEVVRGHDRKLYRAHPLPGSELARIRALTHALVHRDGLSQRQAQRVLAQSYGIRRATGTIARDLALFTCPSCPADRWHPRDLTGS